MAWHGMASYWEEDAKRKMSKNAHRNTIPWGMGVTQKASDKITNSKAETK